MLGDNIFYGAGSRHPAQALHRHRRRRGLRLLGSGPAGVRRRRVRRRRPAVSLEEKPSQPKSNYAVPVCTSTTTTSSRSHADLSRAARGEIRDHRRQSGIPRAGRLRSRCCRAEPRGSTPAHSTQMTDAARLRAHDRATNGMKIGARGGGLAAGLPHRRRAARTAEKLVKSGYGTYLSRICWKGVVMSRLLVTGGAGFIGSNFVHHVVDAHRPPRHGARQAHLRRQPRLAGRPARGPLQLRPGRHLRRRPWSTSWSASVDAVVHFAAESHNDNSLHDPRPFLAAPTWSARTRCSRRSARHGTRFHHISTDEVYGDLELDDPERFTETTPYNPSVPYSSTKAGSDLLVRAWVRSLRRAGDDLELLQQLRPVPARGEVHPAPDHQRASTAVRPEALRRRPQRPRLDPRRRPLLGGADDPRARAGSARRT